ncbi:MAG: permease [Algoriphagus sp.]|uniref:permease n=1 Tax=Algoriphagus sp. TaxID=1872435 RepID=UPI0027374A33|nr:permease [Algoriphagus sp.]MDP3471883.1 permease [Algoriphagus sp.]
MPLALQTSLSLLLMILLGYFLRSKLDKEEHRKGLKVVILDLALPAMIFVALLGIKMEAELVILPALVLAWNGAMLGAGYFGLPWMGVERHSAAHRTWLMLLPSLAPGLSCFPFLIEYLGEEALAWGALADIGNKIYVLIFAYLLAMAWYYRVHRMGRRSSGEKVKQLLLAMLKEPINLVLILAMILLSLGMSMQTLPGYFGKSVLMLKEIMTPLILLFIGMSVVLKWKQIQAIFSVLMLRAGISLLLSGLVVSLFPFPSTAAILLTVVFPLSSCSFWPFAHMSAVRQLELNSENIAANKTFDLELGINILAVSLPFSTLLILGIFSAGEYFTSAFQIGAFGFLLILIPLTSKAITWVRGLDITLDLSKNQDLKNSPTEGR